MCNPILKLAFELSLGVGGLSKVVSVYRLDRLCLEGGPRTIHMVGRVMDMSDIPLLSVVMDLCNISPWCYCSILKCLIPSIQA